MASNQPHFDHDSDHQAIAAANHGWQVFGAISKYAVIAVALVLALMAVFLL